MRPVYFRGFASGLAALGLVPKVVCLAAPLLVASFASVASAKADATSWEPYAALIDEASRRFGVQKRWIQEVLHAESHGDQRAISPAGAMGLMQLMPDTWEELRVRHRLGADVYDARDNILAGSAYLAELYARYGSPGFLAAYNAGPGRYEDYVAKRRPLPAETRAYVAKVAPRIGAGSLPARPPARRAVSSEWAHAPLFVERPLPAGAPDEPQSGGPKLHEERAGRDP